MATFGIRITPDDGGKPLILDGSMRYASFLGSAALPAAARSVNLKQMPSNSMPIIVPRNLVNLYETGNPSSPTNIYYGRSLSYSGNTLTYDVGNNTNGAATANNYAGTVDVFSVAYAASPGEVYGVRITNGANFMEITDTSYLGFVTYRSTISINGAWTIPSDIVALGNYIVFARWSDANTPLFLDRDTNTIRTYNAFSSTNGSEQGGSVSNIQIVVVSCGFTPALPVSGYGMVIRNAANQVTYSSRYPPVMWPDAYYDIPGYENYDDSTGEVLSWANPTGSVSQPMIPLCSLGMQRGDYTRESNGWQYRICLQSGMKMSGNSVSSARARSAGSEILVGTAPKAVQASCRLPCIDASYYF
ncbi:DUF6453 family protein [Mixta mediterraneensis]|uniref:DUF6453 family protein n=1 Tax=Mixta mediterraneensis TaxID=2758443 RepID=UPI0018739992|nr:DUF6453 family protein [Mixta mediterraneensis]MBE5251831.1 hypothetical protein [Mixta mediterraneensis]